MENQLDPSNCLGISTFAENHCCNTLKTSADIFTCKFFQEVIENDEFLCLSYKDVERLISRDEIQVENEEPVYKAVIRWVTEKPSIRERYLFDLIRHVRLPLLSPKFLTDIVDAEVINFFI